MISTLLIANRGEIACRIARTCASLGITSVALYSDADAGALHVRSCDRAVRLPGLTPADTYLRADAIVAAALASGADAVHPGYGFLSESAEFAAKVIAAGLTWVGPPPAAIAAMGSKRKAKELMRAAGVPTLPDGDEAGFPSLIKAVAGGGGRGMRVVSNTSELPSALAAARREALASFGDEEVFRERYVPRGRHIEVQIIADAHGSVAALHERECSIQRRHQKVIEEAPSPMVGPALREALTAAALTAARAVDYRNAGTVEFLVEGEAFFFLEMNTRLQVEHPVTEAITGLDLVALQLRIAEGAPLPPEAFTPRLVGHAIEVRLTAEDPAAGYLPAVGTLTAFELEGTVRVDSGVTAGSEITPYYDSLIAKVIAHGATRAEAIRTLRSALRRSVIGGIATNRDQLVNVLDHPEFLAANLHTRFLDEHPCTDARPLPIELVAAAVWHVAVADAAAGTEWVRLPVGWRNNPAVVPAIELRVDDVRDADDSDGRGMVDSGSIITVRGTDVAALVGEVRGAAARRDLTICLGTVEHRVVVLVDGDRRVVSSDQGQSIVTLLPRFATVTPVGRAGSLNAPMPGTVRRVLVAVGDAVSAGQPVVVLEAMKMEHTVAAPADGTVIEVLVAEGMQADNGAPLLVVE